jgi:predicted transcriptional regulator
MRQIMYRSREEIISQILQVCINGARKRKIVYQANLNFKNVNSYLELLTNSGMLNTETKNELKVYETTTRGLALIDTHKQIQK